MFDTFVIFVPPPSDIEDFQELLTIMSFTTGSVCLDYSLTYTLMVTKLPHRYDDNDMR